LDKKLYNSYNNVGKKFFKKKSLSLKSIKSSIDLFVPDSINKKIPKPIKTEVYALVSGLSFSKKLIFSLVECQINIQNNLKNTISYWVKPENLAVEYCVFKWPHNLWKKKWLNQVEAFLNSKKYQIFDLSIVGIQINPDGCVIAKGYDKGFVREIRSDLVCNLNFIPTKQSNWAHIPLGRILQPIGSLKFQELKKVARNLLNKNLGLEKITEAKIVHETRWYMEKREILYIKKFTK
jgi:hypothetical protein